MAHSEGNKSGNKPDGEIVLDNAQYYGDQGGSRAVFENGKHPYKKRMSRNSYERKKTELQVELLKAQDWVKASGQKIVLLFEGRDAAGKGGAIKRFTEHLIPTALDIDSIGIPKMFCL